LVDVSHGFVTPDLSGVPWGPGFLVPTAGRIREEVGMPVAVGWMITEPAQADAVLREGQADLVLLGREALRNPYWPYEAAKALGLDVKESVLPMQYARAVD
jgi:2,4-dienoyl-CoA reductase-like NADH-dependent reductase (Old Yellow Enzyme family)